MPASVQRLAIGTVQFGLPYGIANHIGQVSGADVKAILKAAAESGIATLDTAIGYGESEQRLGEAGIQGWQVVSKLPAIPIGCGDILQWVAKAVDGTLQRLKINSLYGVLLHRPQQLLEKDGNQLYLALQQLKQDGLVQKIGVSIYDSSELDALCAPFQFDLVQAPFNILDRRLVDAGWLSRLTDHGTELHVRSVFLQGLLLMKQGDRPQTFSKWSALWSQWDEWLEHIGLTPLQACIRFVLSFPQISKVVVGVDSLQQLREILMASVGPSPIIPDGLRTSDLDLICPVNWAALT